MGLGMLSLVLVTSTCQVLSGVVLWILAALDLHINERESCKALNAGSIVTGLFQFLAGLAGLALVTTRKKGSQRSSVRDEAQSKVLRLLPIIYVGLSAAVIVPIIVHSQSVLCIPVMWNQDPGVLTIGIFKLIITYMGFLFSICAVALTLTEYTSFKICKKHNAAEEKIENPNNVTTSTPKKNNKPPTLQLPEAKTHQQEAPGSGEKVTVVTLPEAEGIVYAVPEECYVVKKGESTYVTPPGDHRWTKFFPSYKKVDVD